MTRNLSAPRSWKKIVLLQLLLIPSLLIAADFAVGFATDYDGEETRVRILEIVESVQSGVPNPDRKELPKNIRRADLMVHPYTGFGPRELTRSHNKEFKLAEEEAPADEYRIMILGGSVAAGFGNASSPGVTEVKRLLELDPRFEGRTIRFIPQGFGSFKQPQQLILASYLLGSGVTPHAIICLDGFNEVALSVQNGSAGMNPNYPSFAQWVHLTSKWGSNADAMFEALNAVRVSREACVSLASRAVRFGLHHSSLLGPRVVGRLQHERRAFEKTSTHYANMLTKKSDFGRLAGPWFKRGDEAVVESAVKMWVESTRSLEAICALRGIFLLNVLQPTLHDDGSKTLTKTEIEKGEAHPTWIAGVNLGYPMLRKAGKLLREEGIHHVDASKAFLEVKDSLYFDPCHFNEFGYWILGKFIGEAFLEELPAGKFPR